MKNLIVLILIPLLYNIKATFSFVVLSAITPPNKTQQQRSLLLCSSANTKNDNVDMGDESPKLGIDIGHQLDPLNDIDRENIVKECEGIIDKSIERGIHDLEKLRDRWQREINRSGESLEQAMTLNGLRESKKFNNKVDTLVGEFLSETSASRERIHYLAWEDEESKKKEEKEKKAKSRPIPFESWGKTNNEWEEWDDWDYN